MEIFKRSRSLLSKGFLLLCLVAPMAISCSDVKELREEIDEIKVRLDSSAYVSSKPLRFSRIGTCKSISNHSGYHNIHSLLFTP